MKALLIIDLPNDANIEELDADYQVYLTDEDCNYKKVAGEMSVKLKPMPEQKDVFTKENNKSSNVIGDMFKYAYARGWNECLDEIMGETE